MSLTGQLIHLSHASWMVLIKSQLGPTPPLPSLHSLHSTYSKPPLPPRRPVSETQSRGKMVEVTITIKTVRMLTDRQTIRSLLTWAWSLSTLESTPEREATRLRTSFSNLKITILITSNTIPRRAR